MSEWIEGGRKAVLRLALSIVGETQATLPAWTSEPKLATLAKWRMASRAYYRRWLFIGALIGIVAGIGAITFFWAIAEATHLLLGLGAGYYPPNPAGEGATFVLPIARLWMIPVITTLGGLFTGIIVYTLAPEAEGHGTDAAIEAFHEKGGHIRARIPAIKLIASAITIGSGGSAGREGPTAQIAAGFGSWLGDLLHLNDQDRRIAVAAGVGAGIGAIFKAPFGGALLAGEILYKRDLEAEALFPAFIASVVGLSIYGAWAGWTPVFGMGGHFTFNSPQSLIGFLVLGLVCGGVGLLYPTALYGVRDLFHRIRIPNQVKPAIGGFFVGLIGIFLPQALGMGYGWVQFGIDGNFLRVSAWLMLALVFVKILTTSLTIGSGGSGGVFGPGMVIGGFLGGALWAGLHSVAPWTLADTPPGAFVVVGMGAFFGGVAKAPLAVILMVAEMTGEYSLIVPAMLATMVAYLTTGETSIYESQVDTRLDSPAHKEDFALPLLQSLTVRQAMQPARAVAGANTLLSPFSQMMRDERVASVLIVENEELTGLVTATDMAQVSPDALDVTRARQVMTRRLVRASPEESLYRAWLRMTRRGLRQLAVVDASEPRKLLGVITLAAIGRALQAPFAGPAVATGTTQGASLSGDSDDSAAPKPALARTGAAVGGADRAHNGSPVRAKMSAILEASDDITEEHDDGMLSAHAAKPVAGQPSTPKTEREHGDLGELNELPSVRADPLERITVQQAMLTTPRLVAEGEPLAGVETRLDEHGQALMVVNDAGNLVGLVTRTDLKGRTPLEGGRQLTAGDVAVRKLVMAQPDESLRAAVRRMSQLGIRQLPVVARGSSKLVGLLRRSDVMEAYTRALPDDRPDALPVAARPFK